MFPLHDIMSASSTSQLEYGEISNATASWSVCVGVGLLGVQQTAVSL
jgi:hypothetical protein